MRDTLSQHANTFAGIPDIGTRITLFVVITFMLIVTILLVYFKMRESDDKKGI